MLCGQRSGWARRPGEGLEEDRAGRQEPLRGPGGCLGSDGGWDGGREEGGHRGYAAFWGASETSPGLSLGETKVTWRDGIKEVGRMTREASVPSVRASLLHPSWPPWGPLDYQPVSPRTTQLGLGRSPAAVLSLPTGVLEQLRSMVEDSEDAAPGLQPV